MLWILHILINFEINGFQIDCTSNKRSWQKRLVLRIVWILIWFYKKSRIIQRVSKCDNSTV